MSFDLRLFVMGVVIFALVQMGWFVLLASVLGGAA